jgi:aryl-phospho-beta-D-glucosidase BglC (GH1 family)
VFHGLWAAHLETFLTEVAQRGINLIRVPISTELLLEWKSGVQVPVVVNTFANPELDGMDSLAIFDETLRLADQLGLKIMLDVHSAEADNSGHVAPLWYTPAITEADFIETWQWVAERYKHNDTLIAFDLENEPHGKAYQSKNSARWDDSTHPNNWKRVAEITAQKILAVNPNVLILVEGVESFPKDGQNWESTNEADYFNTWWGGNLRGVRDYPIQLGAHQDQLVYSPHDYGPSVWPQKWFYEGFNKETLIADVWYDNWLYIHDEGIAPLLIGEWGGHMDGGANQHWMTELRELMTEKKIHHTFWCLNPNSGDTGGLVGHDWLTWDEEKYALLEAALWQHEGRYVGLDQDTPLGGTGLSVNEYYRRGGQEPRGQ